MRPIILDQDILKQKSEPVLNAKEATELMVELNEAIKDINNVAGLSAIQIGIPKRIAIITINGTFFLINPTVVEEEDIFIFNGEGCLSFPDLFVKTKRFRHYVINNNTLDNGVLFEQELYFYYDQSRPHMAVEAIAVQHEIDHMNGIVLPEKKWDSSLIGRNDPCPCGAKDSNNKGIKFKKCCGKLLEVRNPLQ